MINESVFFIDLVNAISDNTHWSLQFYSSDIYAALSGITLVKEPATIGLTFTNIFREQIAALAHKNLQEHINFLQVFEHGQKLVEAFDGFAIVTLSKHFAFAGTALAQYLDQDLLYISDEW